MTPFYRHLPLFFLLLLASCASPQKRIKANQAIYDQFPAEIQVRIAQGEIEIGDTPDMVRIAKGDPQYVTSRKTTGAEMIIWRWTLPQTTSSVQPAYVSGRYGNSGTQLVDVQQTQEIEVLRVEFLEGQAVIIEALQE